jgi:selenophosphate synthetase-related protein
VAGDSELELIAQRFRENPSVRAKSALRLVTDVLGASDGLGGPGDDAAAIALDGGFLLATGEAIFPPFVAADPHGAGFAAVLTNLNDVAAMGGRPLAIVDTIVAPEPLARQALEGMREAASLYGVPIVGGHLSVRDGPASISAFALGRALRPLSTRRAGAGQALLLAACLDGEMRPDFPFFSTVRQRRTRMRQDLALLPEAAETGLCVAAKDVSMAGLFGSLAMLLEVNHLGATVDLETIPRPPGVPLVRWVEAFPSYGFLLCSEGARAEDCRRIFQSAELACAVVGTLDGSGKLRARLEGREALLLDFEAGVMTGIATLP